MPMMILGAHMGPHLQREALSRYVHRYTRDHVPDWARKPMPNGEAYPVQFASDSDWLAHTHFPVTKAGNLALRPSQCQSNPTWPDKPKEGVE